MSTFENLEIEKQDQIINGAMHVFAMHGYKKAYMSDIAEHAKVSKPTLFYHFGTKLDLYFYILDTAYREIVESLDISDIYAEKDFFECLKVSTEHKMSALRKRPSLMKFLTKFNFEEAVEISERKNQYLAKSEQLRGKLVFEELDVSKFKDTVDPKMVMDMLLKWNEGYISIVEKTMVNSSDEELSAFYDQMINEFLQLIEMLKANFYLPECL